jgi:hypothetical protein
MMVPAIVSLWSIVANGVLLSFFLPERKKENHTYTPMLKAAARQRSLSIISRRLAFHLPPQSQTPERL